MYYVKNLDHSALMNGFAIVLNDGKCGYIPHSGSILSIDDLEFYFAHTVNDALVCKINSKFNYIVFGTQSFYIHIYTFENLEENSSNISNYLKYIKIINLQLPAPFNHVEINTRTDLSAPKENGVEEEENLFITFTDDFFVMFVLCEALCRIFAFSPYGTLLFALPGDKDPNVCVDLHRTKSPVFLALGHFDYEIYIGYLLDCRNLNKKDYSLIKYNLVKSIQIHNPSCTYNRSQAIILHDDRTIYIASPFFRVINKFKEKAVNFKNGVCKKRFSYSQNNNTNKTKKENHLFFDDKTSHQFTDLRDFTEIQVPPIYLNQNSPIRIISLDKSGQGMVVAGLRGFLHYNLLTRKWKMFGNESQENQFIVCDGCIVWWKDMILLSCYNSDTNIFEFRAYPQASKLDNSHLACILAVPMIFNAHGGAEKTVFSSAKTTTAGINNEPPTLVINHMDVFHDFLGVLFSNRTIAIYQIVDENFNINLKHDPPSKISRSITLVNVNIIDVTALAMNSFNIIAFSLTYFTIDSFLGCSRGSIHQRNSLLSPRPDKLEKREEKGHEDVEEINKLNLPPNVILNVGGDVLSLQHRRRKQTASVSLVTADDGVLPEPILVSPPRKASSSFFSAMFFGSSPNLENKKADDKNNNLSASYDYSVSLVSNFVENFWISELKPQHEFNKVEDTAITEGEEGEKKSPGGAANLPQPYILDTLWLYRGSEGLKVWLPLIQPTGSKSDLFSKRVMIQINTPIYPLIIHPNLATIEGIGIDQIYSKDRTLNYMTDQQDLYPSANLINDKFLLYRLWQQGLPDILLDLIQKNHSLQALDIARYYGSTVSRYTTKLEKSEIQNISEEYSLSSALETLLHRILEKDPSKPIGKYNFGNLCKKTTPPLSVRTNSKSHNYLNKTSKSINYNKSTPPQNNMDHHQPINGQQPNYSLGKVPPRGNISSPLPSPLSTTTLDPEPLMPRVLAFLREFSFRTFVPVLVGCARKSEMALWPKLFLTPYGSFDEEDRPPNYHTHGETYESDNRSPAFKKYYYDIRPAFLFKECVRRGDLETATSLLVILQNLESAQQSLEDSRTLLIQTLKREKWCLAKEIVRYLTSIEEEYENDISIQKLIRNLPKPPKSEILSTDKLLSAECNVCGCNAIHPNSTLSDLQSPTNLNVSHLIEIELENYAYSLAIKHEWKDLATFAANMNFPLIMFLTKFRFDIAILNTKFIEAFKKLHEMFKWPYGHYVNIKYVENGSRKASITSSNSQVLDKCQASSPEYKFGVNKGMIQSCKGDNPPISSPNSILPSIPDINLAKLIEPIEITAVSQTKSFMSSIGNNELDGSHEIVSTSVEGPPKSSNTSFTLERPTSIRLMTGPDQQVLPEEKMESVIEEAKDVMVGNKKLEGSQLWYLLKIFMESACLDWALILSVMLGDLNSSTITLINWIQQIQSQHIKCDNRNECISSVYIKNIVIGMCNLMNWAEHESPYYEYTLCQVINKVMELTDTEPKVSFPIKVEITKVSDIPTKNTNQNCIIN